MASERQILNGDSSEEELSDDDTVLDFDPSDLSNGETLDEDTYGMGIAAIIKDSYWLVKGKGTRKARLMQFTSAILLIVFTISLQGYFIVELGNLVSSVAVTNAREIYEKYEIKMYEPGHLYNNSAGHLRGVGGVKGGYFHKDNFPGLPSDLKDEVCEIPFSQPGFFAAVLIIWTLTVMNNLKRVSELMYHLLWLTPTVDSVKHMLETNEDDKTLFVAGLTCYIKTALFVCICVPRVAMNIVLLWRGTRYLAATFSFADLLLNAIALEFILLLKDLLWTVVISDRNKREVANIRYISRQDVAQVSGCNYLETWFWLILSLLYVGLYFFFQQTLPDYNWDVKDVCRGYLEWKARG